MICINKSTILKNMENHWQVFSAKVLKPIFDGTKSPSYGDLCAQYKIVDETKAAVMTTTVKRRFRTLLKTRLKTQVDSASDVDDEMSILFDIFSKFSA